MQFSHKLWYKISKIQFPKYSLITLIFTSLAPKLDILVNEEGSRSFITVSIPEHRNLVELVKCCDETLVEFDKEVFFKPPNFHISLVWALGDQRAKIDLKNLQICLEELEETTFFVDTVFCKIGNKLYTNKF